MTICLQRVLEAGWVPKTFFEQAPQESTKEVREQRFEWVLVKKRDATGSYIQNRENTASQDYKSTFLHDKKTGNYYLPDPLEDITIKVGLLAIGNPFHVIGAMVYSLLAIPCHIVQVFYHAIQQFVQDIRSGDFINGCCKNFKDRLTEFKTKISHDLWNIPASLYYGVGIQIAAIKGIIEAMFIGQKKIFEARAIMGEIESKWKGVSYQKDARKWCDTFKCQDVETFYLGWCFPPRGSRHEAINGIKKWEVVRRGPTLDSIGSGS